MSEMYVLGESDQYLFGRMRNNKYYVALRGAIGDDVPYWRPLIEATKFDRLSATRQLAILREMPGFGVDVDMFTYEVAEHWELLGMNRLGRP